MTPKRIPERKEVKIMRLAVYLPEDLHRAVMHRCIDEGISATKLTQRLLREYLKQAPKKGGQ